MHGLDEYQQYIDESVEKQVDLIRFYYDDRENMFDSHSYAKGGLILNMLRDYLGDEVFFESLKRYLEIHQYSSVEVHDLRLVFEEVSGEDLNWFFNQWYLASGHPVLLIEDHHNDSILSISVTQLQDLETMPLYQLPVIVEVYTEKGIDSYFLNINQVQQTFEIPLEKAPQLGLFDATQKLLADITHEKTLEEYFFQFFKTDKFLSRYIALDTLLKCNNDSLKILVAKAALDDEFWYFRQMVVNQIEDFKLEYQNVFIDKILNLAVNDTKSLVRADALHILNSITDEKHIKVYQNALEDSSYMVAGSAIYIYSSLDPTAFKKISGKFEDIDNVNIVIPLASFYIDAAVKDKYGWFIEKMNRAQSDGLWYLLQYFGEYMMHAAELTQRKAIVILENYARNHTKIYVRLAAYQALGLLSDLSGVDTLREDIKNNERDAYLRQLYQSLM
jgi:aminopeptidase N